VLRSVLSVAAAALGTDRDHLDDLLLRTIEVIVVAVLLTATGIAVLMPL